MPSHVPGGTVGIVPPNAAWWTGCRYDSNATLEYRVVDEGRALRGPPECRVADRGPWARCCCLFPVRSEYRVVDGRTFIRSECRVADGRMLPTRCLADRDVIILNAAWRTGQ